MFQLLDRLRGLEENIKIGVVGIGSIGKGMALQPQFTPGIECVAIADIIIEKAINWAIEMKRDFQVVETLVDAQDAISRGKLVVCTDGNLIAQCDQVDVFIEATNSIAAGAQFGINAIEHGKHLIMMNYEADLMFGPYLMSLAEAKGLVYTVSDGDQPTVIKHVVDELEFMGFQLVMAGNIKGYLDRYVNPTIIIPEADKRNLDYKMCSSYTDGTKLCIEMAVVANGLGLKTSIPGMHGPRMNHILDIFDYFDFDSIWDGTTAVVDYVLGARPKGGVFAIGYTDHEYQKNTLAWFPPEMGPGPYYVFYKPYHLGHFETMATVARAVLDRSAVLKPRFGFRTNVFAYAKKDLKAGESLDGMGGYACYGLIENYKEDKLNPGIPICLAENVTLKKDVSKDMKISLTDVNYDPSEYTFNLYHKALRSAG